MYAGVNVGYGCTWNYNGFGWAHISGSCSSSRDFFSEVHQDRISTECQPIITEGRAVAQAVSRWLPTAAVRVRVRAECGGCGGQIGTGTGFLRVLRFPMPIILPGAGTIGHWWPQCRVDPGLHPPRKQ
jgi:hypothetical protein